ncbi:hypothetical protein [Streptomyces sp. CC210A]|uniref:hypothetical protein n=1 Tax=Streptomyces sp. CC210A TaxID=2898184 RepID=UPI001F30862B|nr:hypothetical protein [Streptomyces sp. CC210A]
MVDMWDLDSEAIEERVAFRAQVRDLVWRETKRRMRSLGFSEEEGPATPNALAPTSAAAKAVHLMYLEVATEAGTAARDLAADAAARAGRAGATYADLGEASGITRQAARKRWPEAVGTHWALYLLTGKNRPHGRAVQVLRSSSKAIETGRAAVDEGALAEDGAVAAVVINSGRQAVWACYFNDGTYAPEEITLPDELQNVPVPSDEGHRDWQHRWEQHITRLL